jgi:hypothetical protein
LLKNLNAEVRTSQKQVFRVGCFCPAAKALFEKVRLRAELKQSLKTDGAEQQAKSLRDPEGRFQRGFYVQRFYRE